MQGKQAHQPELFSTISIDAFVPGHHLLRRIDRVLDFGFVRELTEPLYCENNGRPSIDPELFFRITLLTYLYDIESDRQVCEEIHYNLAYRWFCRLSMRDSVPDHSSLTRIRDRLGEETFREIFERLISQCIEQGLVKADRVMMDASFLKANAALKSLVEKDEEGNPRDEDDDEPPKSMKGRKFSNDTHVSRTDRDAKLSGKAGEPKQLRYKVHGAIDRKTRLIVDAHVTDGAAVEGKLALGRIEHIEDTFGIEIAEVTADRGYGYGVNLEELEALGKRAYIPNFHSNVGEKVDAKLFRYDEAKDVFRCKAGHKLTRKSTPEQEEKNFTARYKIKGGICPSCPYQAKCFKTVASKTQRKAVSLNIFWKLQKKNRERRRRKRFRAAAKERQWKMEGTFAEAKTFHGLGRARYRGRAKMQIQAYMTAYVINLKRLVGMGLGLCHPALFTAIWDHEFLSVIFWPKIFLNPRKSPT